MKFDDYLLQRFLQGKSIMERIERCVVELYEMCMEQKNEL
jgi:hypothetical protein